MKTGLRLKDPAHSCAAIKACAFLHNFIIQERLEEENDDADFMDYEMDEPIDQEQEPDNNAGRKRLNILFNSFVASNML